MPRWFVVVLSFAALALAALLVAPTSKAVAPANALFERTWARTDRPVLEGQVSRTWMWAPEAFTDGMMEPYAEAPGGERAVQYFDKARMEDNSYRAEGPPWDVTNGLLVVELITGRMQIGDSDFEQREPAVVNVAGDANDPDGPTYASFAVFLDESPPAVGEAVTKRIDRAGDVTDDPGLTAQGVTVGAIDGVTNHAIAAPFWTFINSSGLVYEDGQFMQDQLFEPEIFATGRPVTEAYWADVLVAGTSRLVLIQCFERRCLTYTPGNPDGFVVEAGNVGQHYFTWRYGQPPAPGTPTATATSPEGTVSPTGTATGTVTPTASATPTATLDPATEYSYLAEITTFPDRLSAFQEIDVDDAGNVYILQSPGSGEGWVHRFNASGDYVMQFVPHGTDPGQIDRAAGVAVDNSGHVFVSDFETGRIVRYSTIGNYQLEWGEPGSGNGQFMGAGSIAIDSGGLVYVTEWNNHRVQVFDADGNYIRQWGSQGTSPGQFERPNGIGIGHYEFPGPVANIEGDVVFVSDAVRNNVQAFTTTGIYLGSWGSTGSGPGQFDSPDGVDVDSSGDVYVVDDGNSRVQRFRPTFSLTIGLQIRANGQFVDQWGSEGSGEGQFDVPMGIAVSGDDRVYVVDWFNDRVQVFDTQGTFLKEWTETMAPFQSPFGIEVAGERLYVAATQNQRVVAFSTDLDYLLAWFGRGVDLGGLEFFENPYGVAVGSEGLVYVTDLGNDRVVVYSREGEYNIEVDVGDRPTDLALDGDDNIYVVEFGDHRIAKFSSAGELIMRWGENGSEAGQFENPWSIVVYEDEVFVTDRGNHRIQVFDLDGNYVREWGTQGSESGQLEYPAGIAVDAGGYIYVVDTENHRIQKFDREGGFVATFGGNGMAQGQFERPFGIALGDDGKVYVADTQNNRVQVFEPVS